MDNTELGQDWYVGNDPEVDFTELNKSHVITRYTNAVRLNLIFKINNNIDTSDIKAEKAFDILKQFYDTTKEDKKVIPKTHIRNFSKTTCTTSDENPVSRFNQLKKDIELIEKDLNFYKTNNHLYKGNNTIDKCLGELKNLKIVSEYIYNSDNFSILNKIKESGLKLEKDNYYLLNRHIYNRLNEHLINKVNVINHLRAEKVKNLNEVEYQLYLTPDTMKIRLFTKMSELKSHLQSIKSKIGEWDIKTKKQTISDVVTNIKNNLRLFDKDYQKEIFSKMETLNTRLSGLNEGKENFYQTINKQKIDELYKGFVSSKHVEDLIFKTLTKIDSLENKHEEGAYIFLKLKEMIDQQDKLTWEIKENNDILTNLSSGMKSNIDTMKKNVAYLKQRLANIKK